MRLYKIIERSGKSLFAGFNYKPYLPTKSGKLKDWVPYHCGSLIACSKGYHLILEEDIRRWLDFKVCSRGARSKLLVYEVQHAKDGNALLCSDKVVVRTFLFLKDVSAEKNPYYKSPVPRDKLPKELRKGKK